MLVKSRRRDSVAFDFGINSLIDALTSKLARGGHEHLSLDEVERYLDGRAP